MRRWRSRGRGRPTSLDFINSIFADFTELHGDRRFADDRAVVAYSAWLENTCVTVIGIERARTSRSGRCGISAYHPEGYRKALRQMKLTGRNSGVRWYAFVDTSGAYCGIGAEERGQGQAIAENLVEMMSLKTPVISVLVGEGGSGGALALAVANEVWMLEDSVYSVISPEGCASILWKDSSRVQEACECLKLTADHLLALGVIEKIIPEDARLFDNLKCELAAAIARYSGRTGEEIAQERYLRFRRIGDLSD